jgi:hypothetical protein
MKILLINASGGGFASHLEVAEGTTVGRLFADHVPVGKPQDYLIRVDRLPTAVDEVLKEGSRASITPLKIEGAVVA